MRLSIPGSYIWIHPRAKSANVVWIWENAVLSCRLSATELESVQVKRSVAEFLGFVVGKMAEQSILDKLHSVQTYDGERRITLVTRRGLLVGALSNRPYINMVVDMESSDDRDELFAALRARLEPRLKFLRYEYPMVRTILPYVFGAALVALIAWGSLFTYTETVEDPNFQPHSAKSRLLWPVLREVLKALGPKGITTVGVLGIAVIAVAGIRRLSERPVLLRLS